MWSFIRAFHYKPEVTVQMGFHRLGILRSKPACFHTTWQVLQNSNVNLRQLHMPIIRCLTNHDQIQKKTSWIIRLFLNFYFSHLYLQRWKEQWTLFLINQLKKNWSHYILPKNTWSAFTVSISVHTITLWCYNVSHLKLGLFFQVIFNISLTL